MPKKKPDAATPPPRKSGKAPKAKPVTATAKDGTRRHKRPKAPGTAKKRPGRSVALPLTEKQRAFIRWWMVRRNITRAYMESHPEASYDTARTEGSRLYHDPRIALQIRQLLDEEAERLKSDGQRVSNELAAMGFSSLSDILDRDGNVVNPVNLDREIASAIKKMKRKEMIAMAADEGGNKVEKVIGHIIEVEMHDKIQPLRLLGMEAGMFKEKVEHTADDELLAALAEARARSLNREPTQPE